MPITLEDQRAALAAMQQSALAWWESLRPQGWSLEQHLKHPMVNTCSDSEKEMAVRVANAVAVGAI